MLNFLKLISDPGTFFGQARFHFAPEDGGTAQGGGGGQHKAGGDPSLDGSVSDLKTTLAALDKLPEGDRKAVLTEIATKVKNVQSMTSKEKDTLNAKLAEIEGKRDKLKLYEDIEANPDLLKKVNIAIKQHFSGTPVPAKAGVSDADIIDEWIEGTDDSKQRKDLRRLKEKIEGGSAKALAELDTLRKELAILKSATHSQAMDRVGAGVDSLVDRYGDEHVEKYRAPMIKASATFPQKKGESRTDYMEKLFIEVASPTDFKAAFLNEAKVKDDKDKRRKRDGLEPGDDSVVSDITYKRTKKGQIDLGDAVGKILGRIKSPLFNRR